MRKSQIAKADKIVKAAGFAVYDGETLFSSAARIICDDTTGIQQRFDSFEEYVEWANYVVFD